MDLPGLLALMLLLLLQLVPSSSSSSSAVVVVNSGSSATAGACEDGGDDVVGMLDAYSDFSEFAAMLRGVAGLPEQAAARRPVTLLAPTNAEVASGLAALRSAPDRPLTPQQLGHVARYHVALGFEDMHSLRRQLLPPAPAAAWGAGQRRERTLSMATLFQASGEAVANSGAVTLVAQRSNGGRGDDLEEFFVGWPDAPLALGCRVQRAVHAVHYNLSILEVSKLLVPRPLLPPSLLPIACNSSSSGNSSSSSSSSSNSSSNSSSSCSSFSADSNTGLGLAASNKNASSAAALPCLPLLVMALLCALVLA